MPNRSSIFGRRDFTGPVLTDEQERRRQREVARKSTKPLEPPDVPSPPELLGSPFGLRVQRAAAGVQESLRQAGKRGGGVIGESIPVLKQGEPLGAILGQVRAGQELFKRDDPIAASQRAMNALGDLETLAAARPEFLRNEQFNTLLAEAGRLLGRAHRYRQLLEGRGGAR